MRQLLIVWSCLIFGVSLLKSQEGTLTEGAALLPAISYGMHGPASDLADRFGGASSLGLSLDRQSANSNWLFGLDGHFYFGNKVKEDVLAPIRTAEGLIIATDRNPADVQLGLRGFYLGGKIGKILPLGNISPRSGLRVQLGLGLLQHKVRLQKDANRFVPLIEGEYGKGYDQLTNGLALQQFIGYQILSKNRRINFYAGFEFTEAWTQSRRAFNLTTGTVDTTDRLDVLLGFRLGWVLPFYFIPLDKEIYY